MINFRKTIILKDISNNGASGVLKITNIGKPVLSLSLNCPVSDDMVLLVKTNKLTDYKISSKTFEVEIPVENACDENISSLIINKNTDKALMYGSNTSDKIKCFGLLDEYKNSLPVKQTVNTIKLTENSDDISPKKPKTDTVLKKQPQRTNRRGVQANVVQPETAEVNVYNNTMRTKEEKFAGTVLSEGLKYNGTNFYLAVQPQLDEMFICYPEETALMQIVPNSKWIRVATQNDFYVVGLIYELDEPKYICYGLSGSYNIAPPAEIADICDWLPLNLDNKYGDGYWLIYQDCRTGATVRQQ